MCEQKACTRIFWKMEPPGQFARDHRQVLLRNSWDHLAQEVLISTPRRFGKTISVSMFAAAMLFAAPRVELSIYSTCKRISQKLLRNVQKFFNEMVEHDMAAWNFKVIRQNMEEIVVQGPDGVNDVRVVNSYPSKVCIIFRATSVVLCCVLLVVCYRLPMQSYVQATLKNPCLQLPKKTPRECRTGLAFSSGSLYRPSNECRTWGHSLRSQSRRVRHPACTNPPTHTRLS